MKATEIFLGWVVWTLLWYIVGAGGYSFVVMENFFNPADWDISVRVLFLAVSGCYFFAFIEN